MVKNVQNVKEIRGDLPKALPWTVECVRQILRVRHADYAEMLAFEEPCAHEACLPDVRMAGIFLHETPECYAPCGEYGADGCGYDVQGNLSKFSSARCPSKEPLRFITARPESGGVGPTGWKLLPMFKIAVAGINALPDLLPNHVVELWVTDSQCFPHVGVQSMIRLINAHERGFFKGIYRSSKIWRERERSLTWTRWAFAENVGNLKGIGEKCGNAKEI